MSFGPTSQTQSAFNTLGTNAGAASAAAPGLLKLGTGNTEAGANLFQTLLNGNQAATTAALQPNINATNAGIQQQLQAVNTLTPRGAGRSGTNYALPFAGQQQIQNLFNTGRTTAAQALPQIGAGQTSAGTNLFGVGNSAAGTLGQLGQTQQQITNQLITSLGAGLAGLATTPVKAFTGGLFNPANYG